MKRQHLSVVLFLISTSVACTKYEEGDSGFMARKKLMKTWLRTESAINSEPFTPTSSTITESYSKKNKWEAVKSSSTVVSTEKGSWKLKKNRKEIQLITADDTLNLKITKLTDSELWWELLVDNDTLKVHYLSN